MSYLVADELNFDKREIEEQLSFACSVISGDLAQRYSFAASVSSLLQRIIENLPRSRANFRLF